MNKGESMNLPKEVNILGTTYKIIYQTRVEDSKLKMMNDMIDKGFVKMIDYDDCVELAIHLAEDDK